VGTRTALLIFFALAFFALSPSQSYALQGCCSWHGGVCGSSCCDGSSLSAKCGGGSDSYLYSPPVYRPTTPKFPSSIKAVPSFYPYTEQKAHRVLLELDDSSPTQYSATISKCPGCDPGPLADFTGSTLYFEDVAPGTWYVNVKKKVNGIWSTTAYWTIDVPEWHAPEPTLKPTPAIKSLTELYDGETAEGIPSNILFGGAVVTAALASYHYGKSRRSRQ